MKRSRWIAVAVLCSGALLSTACDELLSGSAHDFVTRSFRAGSGGRLVLDSDSGSIEVSSGGMDQVRVQVEREMRGHTDAEAEESLKQMHLDFRQDGNNLYIHARRPDDGLGFNWGNRLRLRFVVLVPDKYSLDLQTGGGSITVNDVEGSVRAHTSGGNLSFGHIKGTLDGQTSGGSIRLDGGTGPVDVETSGGNVRIGKVSGPVKAHTSGGSINVEEVQGRIEATTSGGSVEATLTRQPAGDCELSTSGGSIHAHLSRTLNLRLEASTGGGTVRTDLPVTLQGESSKTRLNAKMNEGGPTLRLNTLGGSISITGVD
jgi:uncharacterized protein involved in outer membrane biogenesis